jgi:LysR family glycine cleavage system transcriptional activator
MQVSDRISLNALRVFVVAADCGSFKLAASRLGVTPGAISRQVQNLEAALGCALFDRANNAIRLTEAGDQLLRDAAPGLRILSRAVEQVVNAEQQVTVSVSTTLAALWLVPMLERFRNSWPDIKVRIDTSSPEPDMSRGWDLAVQYVPEEAAQPDQEVLLEDRSRPYLSPGLLATLEAGWTLSDVPALQCAEGNWDWKLWLRKAGWSGTSLSFAGHFDLDHVALRAAIAGMGMVLASEFIVRDDVRAGRLIALPDTPDIVVGHYVLKTNEPASAPARRFARWLRSLD